MITSIRSSRVSRIVRSPLRLRRVPSARPSRRESAPRREAQGRPGGRGSSPTARRTLGARASTTMAARALASATAATTRASVSGEGRVPHEGGEDGAGEAEQGSRHRGGERCGQRETARKGAPAAHECTLAREAASSRLLRGARLGVCRSPYPAEFRREAFSPMRSDCLVDDAGHATPLVAPVESRTRDWRFCGWLIARAGRHLAGPGGAPGAPCGGCGLRGSEPTSTSPAAGRQPLVSVHHRAHPGHLPDEPVHVLWVNAGRTFPGSPTQMVASTQARAVRLGSRAGNRREAVPEVARPPAVAG